MSIIKYGSNHPSIILQCDLKSAASVAAAGGVATGSPIYSDAGIDVNDGSIAFTNYPGNAALQYAFQISIDVPVAAIAAVDNSGYPSGSTGDPTSTFKYILAGEDSSGADLFRVYYGTSKSIEMRTHSSDTIQTAKITSLGKASYVTLTAWADGGMFGLFIDGGLRYKGVRTGRTNSLYKLIVGASWDGTSQQLTGYPLKNLVVSRIAPRLSKTANVGSIGIFGDSFAVNATVDTSSARLDGFAKLTLDRLYGDKRPRIYGHGYANNTVCDTANTANNLSEKFNTFNATAPDIAVIMATNNDATSSDTYVFHATTGTEAYLKSWVTALSTNGRTKRVIITTPGSFRQQVAQDTVQINTRRAALSDMILGLPAWWDTTYPMNKGFVKTFDLFSALGGDVDNNSNYTGYWNGVGNIATGGSASPVTPNDRHPHTGGNIIIGQGLFDLITG
mgnify:FL=1